MTVLCRMLFANDRMEEAVEFLQVRRLLNEGVTPECVLGWDNLLLLLPVLFVEMHGETSSLHRPPIPTPRLCGIWRRRLVV